jgi:hypothetical protein
LNVSFTTGENEFVKFNQDGDVKAHYDVMNFQLTDAGSYDYVQIGEWINHTLRLNKSLQYPPIGVVKSVCSDPCPKGYYKVINK